MLTSGIYEVGQLYDAASGFAQRIDELRPYATYAHEYFVAYTNMNAETLAIYGNLHHGWNCLKDGMATASNLKRWIAARNAHLAELGQPIETVEAALYHSATGEKACEVAS